MRCVRSHCLHPDAPCVVSAPTVCTLTHHALGMHTAKQNADTQTVAAQNFRCDKAAQLIGYSPLYSYDEMLDTVVNEYKEAKAAGLIK
eukprot:366048-Chlamydomonas_euryale.AAC.12